MITLANKLLLHVFKDFSSVHTVTSLANALGLSRVGVWKILKRLSAEKYITVTPVGAGKTSASVIKINWANPFVKKVLSLYLAEEALKQRRWAVNFAELEKVAGFIILYGSILQSPQANDIDILGVVKKGMFVKAQVIIDTVQKTQSRKVHAINFTETEFRAELKKTNPVFVSAVKNGVVLFGQDCFIEFMQGLSK